MKLYVGNLSFQTTEGALEELFAQFGTVTEAMLIMDKMSQRSRGFGFVAISRPKKARRQSKRSTARTLMGAICRQ